MALSIKSLPHKSEDLSFGSQKPSRKVDMKDVVVMQALMIWETEAGTGNRCEQGGPLCLKQRESET